MIETLEMFNGNELATSVWKGKYAAKGETHPDEMHRRMAKEFARIEQEYGGNKCLSEDEIFELFKDFRYIIPQGSIMAMLGNPDKIGSLSNCFVIGQPEDSYGGIMQKDEELVQLMKRRGGVGIDLSTLRPDSTPVTNAAGSSTGMASFMHRYSNSTREVAQNGRRGALMITTDIRHPDVLQFINAKTDLTKVTGANISVKLRDDFMQAVVEDRDYILRFPCDLPDSELRNIKIPEDYNILTTIKVKSKDILNIYLKKIKAREYFDKLVENNWLSAEPGVMFVDRHHSYSPDGVYPQYKGITTNPCGEIFMQPYDACRLLAINFFSLVKNPFTDKAEIDYDLLYDLAYKQLRLADDLVDLELEHIDRILAKIDKDPESEEAKRRERELWTKIRAVASAGRRTGCGFTGLGDMLAALGVKYDSQEAKDYISHVMQDKFLAELECTIDMARERGAFKGYDKTLEFPNERSSYEDKAGNEFYQLLLDEYPPYAFEMMRVGRRNVSWSTCAPTGSLSLLVPAINNVNISSGMEPNFMPFHFRNKKVVPGMEGARVDFVDQNGDSWMTYAVVTGAFLDWIDANYAEDTQEFVRQGDKDLIEALFKKSPWYGSCANDIDWIERVEIQSIIQRYTTHSISSTINLPEDVSKEKIAEIYIAAWQKGLKGVTIYRDKCRTGVLVNAPEKTAFQYHDAPKRPKDLDCEIFSTTAKGNRWNVIVGLYDAKPFEVFAVPHFTNEEKMKLRKMSKGRYDLVLEDEVYHPDITSNMTDEESALTRLISTALRHGSSIDFIVEQLNKSHGSVVSFNKAISRILSKYAKKLAVVKDKCSECGSETLIREEGCLKCTSCGASKCG